MDIRLALVGLVHGALLAVGVLLIVIDARTHRLPNRIVLPTLVLLLAMMVVDAVLTADAAALIRGLLGSLALGGFYAVLRLLSRSGMGGGDVKLALVIGLLLAWHGWGAFLLGASSAFVFGAVYALVLLAAGRADRRTRIAFGPWMIAGAVVGIFGG
ncbi:prepilin peptidase [Zhihengliuella sp. ISTPL4]|uniref:prepilin peptidase n=1 Tax=Zhihengliuella sp. ISTPL4 TaxID=2058657 RepID=UPI000C7BA61B|nr:A24 family peptidase [Zhihengliuella sp. ISTPL4]